MSSIVDDQAEQSRRTLGATLAAIPPKFWCGQSAPTPRKHMHPEPTKTPSMRYCEGGFVSATWRDGSGIESSVELNVEALREMLAFAEREEIALQERRAARKIGGAK